MLSEGVIEYEELVDNAVPEQAEAVIGVQHQATAVIFMIISKLRILLKVKNLFLM